jgi:hypothetical protein
MDDKKIVITMLTAKAVNLMIPIAQEVPGVQ